MSQRSVIDFRDNIENFRRKSCRSRSNKRVAPYKARVVCMPLLVSPENPLSRTQFTAPLRASPLPELTMADFEPSPAGNAAYQRFREHRMMEALVLFLSSPIDIVQRQLAIVDALHVDGLGAKVCPNPLCRERFCRLYATTKRKCKVRPAALVQRVCQTNCCAG